jgi:iron(III) transport system ATP-binding protein
VALRAENVRLGERARQRLLRPVIERRYQGMQTVYDVELGGQRLEALELGTAARHEQNGEIAITLPPDTCWAYRDDGTRSRG